jgi:two-component system, cell cycle sensor histidine kinase and response regulator CckA
MDRLVTVIQELSKARDLPSVQAVVRSAARELTGADGATFVLREGDACFYADEDAIAPLWKGQRFPMSACISGWTMLNKRPALIEDIYADARIPADAYRPTFVKSLVMVPVRSNDPVAAIGTYWAEKRLPSDAEVRLLQALADSTSVALENVALYAELEARIRERSAAVEVATRAEAEARRELAERQRAEATLRSTEEQLRQAQKMDAVGRLAGGIAHDFNNLLSVILGYGSIALESLDEGAPLRTEIREICKAGERAAALTKRLLTFSRTQVLDKKVVDVGEVVRGMDMMLRRLIGAHMNLEITLGSSLFPVLADVSQLEQVLVNLVVNARDAMPNGGKLTVEVGNVHLTGEYTSSHLGVADGDYLMLAVSDTGIGMDKQTQAHIFEPFFTTKETGRGTGLGLSTVYGIVKQSGGHIWVYSEVGEGTSFKIYLPRCAGGKASVTVPTPVVAKLTGTETILVAEDDDQVRVMVRGILRRHGYHVIEARNASEAMAALRERTSEIALLLTDAIMPDRNGMRVIESLRTAAPAVKAICMSGYPGEAALRSGLVESDVPFLPKPVTPEALLRRVREVLDQGAAG